jgi:NAD(P)-dependent dehydrogenase (short-subunit alcohol dehydrogenase family)
MTTSIISISSLQNVLILGAGDIGQALCLEVLKRSPSCHVYMTSRKAIDGFSNNDKVTLINHDLEKAETWQEVVTNISAPTLDLIISTWGFLHDDHHKPEKSLRDINFETMSKSFHINAMSAPLAAHHFEAFLAKDKPSAFVFLSAKVGSIADNHLGGWYSYRASKAALNMFLKTISIEWARKKIPVSVMAIHPGTTQTRLSRPYLKSSSLKVWQASESAIHICDVIERSYGEGTGLFKNWDHTTLPW